jgi:hypothetical protein
MHGDREGEGECDISQSGSMGRTELTNLTSDRE